MTNVYRFIFLATLVLCLSVRGEAQDSTKNSATDHSYFEAGIDYLSNNVYLGRHDSLRIPYLTPTISYYNKTGFYATGSLSYLASRANSEVDLLALGAGYSYVKNKFSADLSLEKDFYNSASKNVRAETKGSLNATVSYDPGFIQPVLQGGMVFNIKNDYYAGFGLSHAFYFDDDNFQIDPSFLINASTQNYYNAYYSKRKYKVKRKNGTVALTSTRAYLPNTSQFKIMDYELSVPVEYALGNFIFNFTPAESIPVNPNVAVVTVTPPSGNAVTKTKTEKLSSIFYWSAGFTYTF